MLASITKNNIMEYLYKHFIIKERLIAPVQLAEEEAVEFYEIKVSGYTDELVKIEHLSGRRQGKTFWIRYEDFPGIFYTELPRE